MSIKNPNTIPDAMRLLSGLLYHGGFCTVQLAAAALDLPVPETRRVIGELVALGYLRKVFLLRAHDATSYFQITRRASRLLGHPAPNCARSDPSDSQILRGCVRFWFSSRMRAESEDLLSDEVARAYFYQNDLIVPNRWPVGDSYILTPAGLQVWTFPGADQQLDAFVKQSFLRYSDDLDKLKIGFVINSKRAVKLAEILSYLTGEPQESTQKTTSKIDEIDAEIANLSVKFRSASASEKASIHMRMDRLSQEKQHAEAQKTAQKPASTGGLSDVILPLVVHDLY